VRGGLRIRRAEGLSWAGRIGRVPTFSGEQASMYVVVREYRVRPGQMDYALDQVRTQLAPLIQEIPGFVGYTVIVPGETQLASMGFFRDKAGADVSTRAAAELVKRVFQDVVEGEPRVTSGEAIIREGDATRQARFAIIRRFSMTPEQVATSTQRVREGLLPILRSAPGFVAYSAIDAGDGVVVSTAAFESRETAEATQARAMAWAEQAMTDIPDPEVMRGDIKLRIVNEEALAGI